jgi:hypothetical protein
MKLPRERKSWLLLSHQDGSQYAGNEGYKEDPTSFYEYDSNVGNSRQLSVGDKVVICGRNSVTGHAVVESIVETPEVKIIRSCPECGNTNIKLRKTKMPRFRCDNKHEFDEPIIRHTNVTRVTAYYAETFEPSTFMIDAKTAKGCSLYPRARSSIRPLDPDKLRLLIPTSRTNT